MEPYSIRCTTCRAKLKVRKPEAVGQIVSCPRCGSMVMVHPQAPQSDSSEANVDDVTLDNDSKPHRVSRPSAGKLSSSHLDNESYDSVNALLDDDDGAHRRDTKVAASAATATLASKSRARRPNPSHAEVTMGTTRNMSGLRIFGRAALLAIAMGVGAAIATGSYYLSKRAPLARDVETIAPVEEAVAVQPTWEVEDTESEHNAEEVPRAASREPDSSSLEIPDHSATTEPPVAATTEFDPSTTEQPFVQTAQLDDSNEAQSQLAAAVDESRPSPVQLARLRIALKPNLPVSEVPVSTVELPPRRDVDVEARLSETMGKLNLPKITVKDMARLMSSISTVPISFDDSAFAFGATPGSSVSATADNESVQSVVNRAMKRLKLVTRIDGDHLVIEHVSRTRSESKQVQHDVSDLATHDDEFRSLTKTINDALPQLELAFDSRITAGSAGRLTAKLPHYGHLQLAVLLDQIRTARGLEFDRRFSADVTSIQPAYRAADRRLSNRITLRHEKPVRLDQLLNEFEEQTKLHVLVDWHALDREGWNESTLISSNSWQEPAIDVLSDMLAQFGGAFVTQLPNTISITLPSVERERFETGFFPIDDLLNAGHPLAQVIELTKQSIGTASFADQGGEGTIAFDEVSRTLIIRLPQSDLRVVDQIMANWRSLN